MEEAKQLIESIYLSKHVWTNDELNSLEQYMVKLVQRVNDLISRYEGGSIQTFADEDDEGLGMFFPKGRILIFDTIDRFKEFITRTGWESGVQYEEIKKNQCLFHSPLEAGTYKDGVWSKKLNDDYLNISGKLEERKIPPEVVDENSLNRFDLFSTFNSYQFETGNDDDLPRIKEWLEQTPVFKWMNPITGKPYPFSVEIGPYQPHHDPVIQLEPYTGVQNVFIAKPEEKQLSMNFDGRSSINFASSDVNCYYKTYSDKTELTGYWFCAKIIKILDDVFITYRRGEFPEDG